MERLTGKQDVALPREQGMKQVSLRSPGYHVKIQGWLAS